MSTTTMVMPDLHAPDHDERALAAFLLALDVIQPDRLLILGDFIDCKAPARWSKQTAEEYAGTLPAELDAGKQVLEQIRGTYSGLVDFISGNHEARINQYVNQYAPAISGLVPSLSELLDFPTYGVVLHAQPYEILPGVSAIHGKRLSSVLGAAGQSAFKERSRHGTSVVQGHSHRLGIGWDTQERSRFWMECGHLSSATGLGYLEYNHANWQHGFGMIHTIGFNTFPSVHSIHDGVSAFNV